MQLRPQFTFVHVYKYVLLPGTTVAQWLRCCATNRKVAGSIPGGVIGTFHWHKILPIALWPRGSLSLQQKWVPRAFPGGKGGRCVMLTALTLASAVVMKSENLNFPEPSGPLQACNGTALPFLCVITGLACLRMCLVYAFLFHGYCTAYQLQCTAESCHYQNSSICNLHYKDSVHKYT